MIHLVEQLEHIIAIMVERQAEHRTVAILGIETDATRALGIHKADDNAAAGCGIKVEAQQAALGAQAKTFEIVARVAFTNERELARFISTDLDKTGERTSDEGRAERLASSGRNTRKGAVAFIVRARAAGQRCPDVVLVDGRHDHLLGEHHDVELNVVVILVAVIV